MSQRSMFKPPNILVRVQNKIHFEAWKNSLSLVLMKDMYTIYSLSDDQLIHHPWQDTCALMVYEFGKNDLTKDSVEALGKFISNKGKVLFHHVLDAQVSNLENDLPEEVLQMLADHVPGDKSAIKPGVVIHNCFCVSDSHTLGHITSFQISAGKLTFYLENLGLAVQENASSPRLTPGVLYSTKGLNPWEIFRCEKLGMNGHKVLGNDFAIHLYNYGDVSDEPAVCDTVLPVYFSDKESDLLEVCAFDFNQYKQFLSTKHLGRNIMCVDVIGSTQDLLKGIPMGGILDEGFAVVARQQMKGKGRAGNVWLSPPGCMMVSCQLSLPVDSYLGKSLPYIQHICATAAVAAVKSVPGYEKLDLNLKWPNDIYIKKQVKIGLNISNAYPTSCVNSLIAEHNRLYGTNLQNRAVEEVLARTFNNLEELIDLFEAKGATGFCEEYYYRHWMHGGCRVIVEAKGNAEGIMVGLDGHGYLLVELCATGETLCMQPDGNSFDMMRNMIVTKHAL